MSWFAWLTWIAVAYRLRRSPLVMDIEICSGICSAYGVMPNILIVDRDLRRVVADRLIELGGDHISYACGCTSLWFDTIFRSEPIRWPWMS